LTTIATTATVPSTKANDVTGRPSQDEKQEWEGHLTIVAPSRTGTTSGFRHAALPLNCAHHFRGHLSNTKARSGRRGVVVIYWSW
jgi:hypothetical protein